MTYTPGSGYPTLAEIRDWILVPATALADPELELIAGAEQTLQASGLEWADSDAPDPVIAAFMRRVARATAAKGIPLGILAADAEFGTVRLSKWDAEIDRYEAGYLPVVVVGPYGWTEGP